MNKLLIVGAGFGAMLLAGVAVAQGTNNPPSPGASPPPGEMGGSMRGPHGGPDGEMRGSHGGPDGEMRGSHGGPGMMRMMHEMHRHESKAAHFRFRKGDAMVDIKCADDEPTKACVDAGAALLDKLATK